MLSKYQHASLFAVEAAIHETAATAIWETWKRTVKCVLHLKCVPALCPCPPEPAAENTTIERRKLLKAYQDKQQRCRKEPVTRTSTFITPVLLNCFQNFFEVRFLNCFFFFVIFILCLPPCSWKAWQDKGCVDFHPICFTVIPRMYFRARQS